MGELEKPETGKTKELLDDEYFRLALENQVRDRVDAYLKRLGAFALILLAVAGYSSWNLVDEARKKYEKEASELKTEAVELKKEQDQLRDKADKLGEKSLEAQKSALDAQKEAFSATRDAGDAEKSKQAAQGASAVTATEAQHLRAALEEEKKQADLAAAQMAQNVKDADDAKKDAERNADLAKNANKTVQEAQSELLSDAEQVSHTAKELKSLLPAQVQLVISRETQELLVRGKKTPCVELMNWVQPKGEEFGLLPQESPERFYVRFRVRHIHLHPVDLYMEILKDPCPKEDEERPAKGEPTVAQIFEYTQLPKNSSQLRAHPIPETPFAFRMTFVYDALLTYDFVVLAITAEQKLLRDGPDYKSGDPYSDPDRHVTTSAAAFK